ncbi:MAG: four helix bundle protein [Verrucomicrobia bacterium]|nr:four helix bundle protein [Verrucomicrobiota bacterium]
MFWDVNRGELPGPEEFCQLQCILFSWRGLGLKCSGLDGQSIPLNIAKGNGKTAQADRRRYFENARGSALECAAIQDVLVAGNALDKAGSRERKTEFSLLDPHQGFLPLKWLFFPT